jgi:hypothetical protein
MESYQNDNDVDHESIELPTLKWRFLGIRLGFRFLEGIVHGLKSTETGHFFMFLRRMKFYFKISLEF